MNPFSICLIAKNEENKIERCLSAASKLDAEIVLVDTGSTDRTKELAAKYTDKIYDFEWCNDFSAARNFSISKATYDWILVLDCDEYVESFDLDEISSFMTTENYNKVGTILCRNQMNSTFACMESQIPRFFHRNHIAFYGNIHEQLLTHNNSLPAKFSIPLTIYHDGYAGSDEFLKQKSKRNIELLLEQLKNDPNNPYLYFQLGQSASQAGAHEDAYHYYYKGLSFDVDPQATYVKLMVISYGESMLLTKRYEEALCLENIYEEFSNIADFVCVMAIIYLRNNQPVKAILEFMKALTKTEKFRDDTNNNFPRHYIGLIYEALGDTENAIAFFKACNNYPPALESLKKYQ
ncbi:MAG: glycosyltransferase [Lachnospiraceae bacterium]|nr:glycosyltransferase [Lachnospiraceae bacterium]MBO5325270.1 glycosyltransferase [Lachnospiraceae bacterium]